MFKNTSGASETPVLCVEGIEPDVPYCKGINGQARVCIKSSRFDVGDDIFYCYRATHLTAKTAYGIPLPHCALQYHIDSHTTTTPNTTTTAHTVLPRHLRRRHKDLFFLSNRCPDVSGPQPPAVTQGPGNHGVETWTGTRIHVRAGIVLCCAHLVPDLIHFVLRLNSLAASLAQQAHCMVVAPRELLGTECETGADEDQWGDENSRCKGEETRSIWRGLRQWGSDERRRCKDVHMQGG